MDRKQDIKEQVTNIMIMNNQEPTFRIVTEITNLIDSYTQGNTTVGTKDFIDDFMKRETTIDFINERQPLLSVVPDDVVSNIVKYFKSSNNGLANYKVLEAYRSSNCQGDSYLYCVIAYNHSSNMYACWSSWNEETKNLNHGHYGLSSLEQCRNILKDNYYDITEQPDKYNMESSCKVVNEVCKVIDIDSVRGKK